MDDLCYYGCGQKAITILKNGRHCCSEKYRGCPAVKASRNELAKSQRGRKKSVSYKACQFCGAEIATNNLMKHERWCSGEGKNKKTCSICGKIFYAYGNTKTCSDQCKSTMVSEQTKLAYASGKIKPFGGAGCRSVVNTSNGEIQVMSSYEAEACVVFDNWLKAKKIAGWEYTKDRFSYLDENGTERTYFPDFKIIETDGSFYYLETKGFEKIRDKYKWNAVEQQGHKIVVWFKDDITQHKDNKD